MLPDALLNYSVVGNTVVAHFLGEHDHPWLRVLVEEFERFVGRPERELDARLREPLACESPAMKLKQAAHVLAGLTQSRSKAAVPPRRARALVFGEAARSSAPPEITLGRVAGSLGVSPGALEDSLFADLPGNRLLAAPALLSPVELALRTNLALAQALLFRAVSVKIEAEGNARALVRTRSGAG